MTTEKFIPIYCETQRKREMRACGPRGGRLPHSPVTGRAYATQVDGEWRCLCCGSKVRVAW